MTNLLSLDRTLWRLTSPRRWSLALRSSLLLMLPVSVFFWVVAVAAVCAIICARGLLRSLVSFWTVPPRDYAPCVSDLVRSLDGSVTPLHCLAGAAPAQFGSKHSSGRPMHCRLGLHKATSDPIWNAGWYFGRCKSCETELIRMFRGRWRTVPKGYRIVWMTRADWHSESAKRRQRIDKAS